MKAKAKPKVVHSDKQVSAQRGGGASKVETLVEDSDLYPNPNPFALVFPPGSCGVASWPAPGSRWPRGGSWAGKVGCKGRHEFPTRFKIVSGSFQELGSPWEV